MSAPEPLELGLTAEVPEDPADPAGWVIPSTMTFAGLGVCSACREAIAWAITAAHKRAPLNRDGVSHFATCPFAHRFRR